MKGKKEEERKKNNNENCKSPMYRQRLMTKIKNVTEEKEK